MEIAKNEFDRNRGKQWGSNAALLFLDLPHRWRLRISAETKARWLIIRCKEQQKQPVMRASLRVSTGPARVIR
jgi:hypothetical protein